ncbi:hypothetical protein GIB67_035827 [Kingdonia uniflora]|uniref:SMP-LTD domain-containing protein n=1 Tax=Kingdonia uniflora TaxID=39325 RepID=A0A7J7MJW7_9MAGN|nr:hypothetical protein GIB67_035827 [Kingdonia uniflora]
MTQFTGVLIIEDGGSGCITLELELQWDGNPNIFLDIKMMVGVALPVQVKNIGFTGAFRLIFKPLVEEIPCVGVVSYSLRQKKKLDYTLKVVGGDLSSVPWLADAIEGTIMDVVEDVITWPVRKVIPIIPGDYSDLELKPEETLEVKLASELLGCAQVQLKDLEPGKVKDVWLKLVKDLDVQRDTKNRGQVHLELLYYHFGSESGFTNLFAVAAAEAEVTAARAAAVMVKLAGGSGSYMTTRVDWAADRIQATFRGYLTKKALWLLKGLVKLQALLRGHIVRKKIADTMRAMQVLARG